jgi:hypothetical protein
MSGKQRKIPDWMKYRAKKSKENADNNKKPRKNWKRDPKKLNLFKDENNRLNLSNDDGTATYSSDRFDSDDKEFITYSGKIHYITDFYICAETFDKLLTQINEETEDLNERLPVAFDMEWSFNWTSGPDKTSVIQICSDLNDCYVVQVSKMNRIPASFVAYLNHPKTLLHGVNIKNDLRKLERDFPYIKADPLIEKCVDLGTFYNQVFNSSERWSLANLALHTLKQKVDKSRQVRMSYWHMTLSEKQLMYASLDVYVSIIGIKLQMSLIFRFYNYNYSIQQISQKIYYFIKEKQTENSQQLEGFFSVYTDALSHDRSTNINDEIEKLLNV